ncbi:hypothetical protein MUK42_37354 [Musa troglodytarum]|uniref:Uncharacterized protein n=1 Tax=Musa troglodytarum TaxID=320322 RepID=A0A9E7EFV5_9LILI|nr:hypothetical protein MUK42_37354 [Musa troglodytarum]
MLLDNISKMEADLKASEPVSVDLQQSLVVARQELISSVQQLTEDLQRRHGNAQQSPSLMSELEVLRQEYQDCRATYDYERKLHMDHYESLQVMEKNYVSMERGPSVGAVSYDRAVAGSVAARALHDAPRGHAYGASKGFSYSSPRVAASNASGGSSYDGPRGTGYDASVASGYDGHGECCCSLWINKCNILWSSSSFTTLWFNTTSNIWIWADSACLLINTRSTIRIEAPFKARGERKPLGLPSIHGGEEAFDHLNSVVSRIIATLLLQACVALFKKTQFKRGFAACMPAMDAVKGTLLWPLNLVVTFEQDEHKLKL